MCVAILSYCNTNIIQQNTDDIIKLFEELGFEGKHQKDGIDGKDISSVRMTDANGFHVDVAISGKKINKNEGDH